MKEPNIINIQKFSVHDGEGIRTTIFFKGCNLRCLWCHNPESWKKEREVLFSREKCVGCSLCVKICPQKAISIDEEGKAITNIKECTMCETCLDYCLNENREIVGEKYSIEELMKIIKRDLRFYEESGGGVTLSGGEVMIQDMDYIEELCKRIKKEDINLAIDTCGDAPVENFQRLLKYVDTFLYDIKVIDDEVHKKYIGKSNEKILNNLSFISKNIEEDKCSINIRIPVVEGVNSDEKSIGEIIEFLHSKNHINKVNLLPYHNTGSSKYEKLGMEYRGKNLKAPSDEDMENIKYRFIKAGFSQVKIGG